MAGGKEIRTKIASVKNTQKITKAMEMVAASKMRKAQDRMLAARPYAEKIRNVISHLAHANSEYKHPYLNKRDEIKRIGLIIVSTDRGLCGGLNANMFRMLLKNIQSWEQEGKEVDLCVIGTKAAGFFGSIGANIVGQVTHIGDEPSLEELLGTIMIMLNAYKEEKIDELYLVSNQFVNSMVQTPTMEQLIPGKPDEKQKYASHWDYIYEPDAEEVLDGFLSRYIESQVYAGVIENISCEMAARMVAMKSATENAGALIDELQLIYNKARQAAITQELSEIVAGAAAV
ncbi:MAG: F0F1 ATP synthase subunit gamma [Legionellales bacterium]|jgi:F-type H+-transporting ATPase subunit gamma|nr:F0F1 ATP synthase subunit gamma [Legionellales bacterium]|tara:strand:+ start:49 stop:912 length:864 start_codon:yes stop_codon:yes gene_type:complete